jgi:hypothetical protein
MHRSASLSCLLVEMAFRGFPTVHGGLFDTDVTSSPHIPSNSTPVLMLVSVVATEFRFYGFERAECVGRGNVAPDLRLLDTIVVIKVYKMP